METKPKNFAGALEELEKLTHVDGQKLKDKLFDELATLEEQIKRLKPQLDELKDSAKEQIHQGKNKVETQIKAQPWLALCVAGVIGLVLGLLLGRKSR